MSRDDQLALTATAADSSSPPTRPAIGVGSQLGRYAIERLLGAGGMGVVYAAFDPDLERRVALKVLRPTSTADAEQRLLREARAMARLTHPNVVAVYEVGTIEGRDYIAMELIDGVTLLEWQQTAKPEAETVLRAFIAAGRGIASAHEAGIVHRDFKPHNVLRDRRGRVVVTDFGLAHADETDVATRGAHATSSPLSDLTAPGSLLGTPAYMAPEQWTGGEVTPATDQFAFCVALWEALAGARPFPGTSIDELRDQITCGPEHLDASALPRRLRATLLRGLSVDPARRWPAMDALLARLEPKRRWVHAAIAGVVAAALAAVSIVTLGTHAAVASCEPPATRVWGPTERALTRATSPLAADRIGATLDRWQDVRANVCAEPSPARGSRLACLDKVISRIDALRRARLLDPRPGLGVIAQLDEPDVCLRPDPPHLPDHYSDAAIIGLALRASSALDSATVAKARPEIDRDACARAYFGLADGGTVQAAEATKNAAQLCGDDQAYATAAMHVAELHAGVFPASGLGQEMREVERAVTHAAQPFLVRQYWLFRGQQALRESDLDGALTFLDRAAGGEPMEFEIDRRALRAGVLLQRAGPGDLDAVLREVEGLRTIWIDRLAPRAYLDAIAATARWNQGAVAEAHPMLVAAQVAVMSQKGALPPGYPSLQGTVVDEQGAPVAGATVAVGIGLIGDAVGIMTPLYSDDGWPQALQQATTDATGHFTFARVARRAVVVAQRGDLRSVATPQRDGIQLVLAPTTSVRGRVRGALARGQHWITTTPDTSYTIAAPVRADGTFELGGLPRAAVSLRATTIDGLRSSHGVPRALQLGVTTLADVEIMAPSERIIDVIVRSRTAIPVEGAVVTALAGTHHPATVGALQTVGAELVLATDSAYAIDAPPPALAGSLQRGDLLAHVRGAPAGVVTICAQGFNLAGVDSDWWSKFMAQQAAQPIGCVTVDGSATRVIVETPGMNRVE